MKEKIEDGMRSRPSSHTFTAKHGTMFRTEQASDIEEKHQASHGVVALA
jgi:hypothetical protein